MPPSGVEFSGLGYVLLGHTFSFHDINMEFIKGYFSAAALMIPLKPAGGNKAKS
jgi:hypothetical protein